MRDFLAETFTAPLTAARGPAGRSPIWARAVAALALGSLGSGLAIWILAGRGAANLGALAASLTGRLLTDAALWLVVAGLLGAAEPAPAPGPAPGLPPPPAADGSPADRPAWHLPVAVAAAQRAWLAPVAAMARLTGLTDLGILARPAAWLWALGLLWVFTRERGHTAGQSLRLLALGLALPLALALGGLLLSGLGWVLTPLWPGGITPFLPL